MLSNWRFEGFVVYSRLATEWLRKELGASQRSFAKMLHEYVVAGSEIDQMVETRPEWTVYSHHYDLRLKMDEQVVYVETRLDYSNSDDPDDPIITIVNVHLA